MKKTLKKIIEPTLTLASIGIESIMRVHNEHGNPMTKKQLSECISGVVESKMVEVARKYGIQIESPKVDSEPDIIINYKPLEIKTTSSVEWRGGAYSKRESDYLFIKWDYSDGEFTWFALHKYLKEDDWNGGDVMDKDNNYYATKIKLNEMLDGEILVGGKEKKTVLYHPVLQTLN